MALSKTREHIIYISSLLTSFVRNDIELLQRDYHVVVNVYPWHRQWLVPVYALMQLIFLLFNLNRCQAVVISSGGYWAFLPALLGKMLHKPVWIILNGADCCAITSLNYGSLRKYPNKLICKLSYRLATRLLPVSSSLISVQNTYDSDPSTGRQGYQYYFPEIMTPATVMHNGVDEVFWNFNESQERNPRKFITAFQASQFLLKGGDLIFELARLLPDCTFVIAGMEQPVDMAGCPRNISFLGFVDRETLREEYCSAQFYFQLSVFEGFGCALCEAMLCGCIPIVSHVNMLPELAGDAGYVLPKKDRQALHALANVALNASGNTERSASARAHILDNYTLQHRWRAFQALLQSV